MADRLIFIGWNRPVVGREQQAMKLFQKRLIFKSDLNGIYSLIRGIRQISPESSKLKTLILEDPGKHITIAMQAIMEAYTEPEKMWILKFAVMLMADIMSAGLPPENG